MPFFKRMLDFFTLGSQTPIRRLVAYYTVLAVSVMALAYFFPFVDRLFSGERLDQLANTPQMLQDAMILNPGDAATLAAPARAELAFTTMMVFLATLALMLPVSWVYMSTRKDKGYDPSVVHALVVLPMVVAGVVLIVRNSLALAFTLAGVVAAVRFRTNLGDARDVVFLFLAIAIGFAAGVQVLTVAVLLSILFNFVILLIWRYEFGRNVLDPAAGASWAEPLNSMAVEGNGSTVPDRDLVLALTPTKAQALSDRFDRVRAMLGSNGKNPRYNAILTVRTNTVGDAQSHVEGVLETGAKRWKLDEVVSTEGKPSEMFYLVRTRKSVPSSELATSLRTGAGGMIDSVDMEVGRAIEQESGEKRADRKAAEKG